MERLNHAFLLTEIPTNQRTLEVDFLEWALPFSWSSSQLIVVNKDNKDNII